MIRTFGVSGKAFVLDTENTTYAFRVTPSGHTEHIYYGAKTVFDKESDLEAVSEKHYFVPANCIAYSKEYPATALEDMCLEISSMGHGDVREPFLEIVRSDGSSSSDFLFSDFLIDDSPPSLRTLPSSYTEDGGSEHLCVTLKDDELVLELHYQVYPECNIITRYARLTNSGKDTVRIERLLSMQLDLPESGLAVSSFRGAWAREMNRHTITLEAGKLVTESRTGTSSNRANPFFMVHDPRADENSGRVYGFNLVYSGNHYSAAEVSAFGKTRVVSGIQPQGFRFVLEPGESLESPEAVMTFSDKGFTGQSINMHAFVREHIVRGKWKYKTRPVLLNSWEACYFKINSRKLLSLARAGKRLGAELFVMDDGWFGRRDNDTSSLGDWQADTKKLPGGLKALADRINRLGMKFGIWVEPEMMNTDSDLYRSKTGGDGICPWVMQIGNRLHSEGRNQRILDLTNPEVQDHIIEKMTEVFSSANIAYVKWDMNRIFSDVFSPFLPARRQGETAHRYVCGLYRILDTLTKRFPEILFEGCSSGGNRSDLGILCFFPQIWASDNTDALCRVSIQEGYSFGYPQSCIGAHVSAVPNHQTMRTISSETRFNIAAFGLLGYELDIRDLRLQERNSLRRDIRLYKEWRDVFQFGQFYRIGSGNIHQWLCVSKDRKRAVGMLFQERIVPGASFHSFRAAGLDPDKLYKMYSIPGRLDVRHFGSMINNVVPVHIKTGSAIHELTARIVNISGESEEMTASGSVFMNAGVSLKPAYSAAGYDLNTRVFPDFASRMFFFVQDD